MLSVGALVIVHLGPAGREAGLLGTLRRSLLETGECQPRTPTYPDHLVQPSWAASYPGSGAKMTWNLIEALTGVTTGDDWLLNGVEWSRSVTVKTHWPHPEGNQDVQYVEKAHFPRTILILRHPMDAIPGYHNFLYERDNNLPGHSTRAPLSAWLQWRDENFETEMARWLEHTAYWMDRYGGSGDKLIVSYEGVTDDESGPAFTYALATFLDASEGTDAITDNTSCIWQKIIKYKGKAPPAVDSEGDTTHVTSINPDSHRSGNSYHPYSNEQVRVMIQGLADLANSYAQDEQLVPILKSYLQAAEELLPKKTENPEVPTPVNKLQEIEPATETPDGTEAVVESQSLETTETLSATEASVESQAMEEAAPETPDETEAVVELQSLETTETLSSTEASVESQAVEDTTELVDEPAALDESGALEEHSETLDIAAAEA